MNLDVFELIITTLEKQSRKSFEISKLGIDLLEYEDGWIGAVSLLVSAYYGTEATRWIEWYLYDREGPEGKHPEAKDKDGTIICNDVHSLWKKVEEIRVSNDFIEFSLPEKKTVDQDDLIRFFAKKQNIW